MPLEQLQSDVMDFHVKFGLPIASEPEIPPGTTSVLRWDLIKEEMNETLTAIANDDLEGIADGIVDSVYVLVGTAISYGIDLSAIWTEVHRTNMAKEGGKRGTNGKILKPEGWKPPNIGSILRQQSA